MKTKVVFLLCMIVSVVGFGQNEIQELMTETKVVPPKFPIVKTPIQDKSIESINDYLASFVQYPDNAVKTWLEGTEVVRFVVTPTGELTNFKVINSVCSDIDKEVIRVLNFTSGQWRPGTVDGEPVAMEREVSMNFKIFEKTDFVTMARKFLIQGGNLLFVEKNPKKAMRYLEKGINLLPNEESLLTIRGMCKYELGDKEGARSDWDRIKNLSDKDKNQLAPTYLAKDFSQFNGYAEMIQRTRK